MINKFFTLLGYTNNSIIKQYQEKYFQKIFGLAKKILGEHVLFQKNQRELKDFLLHPDISSLIQDFALRKTEQSLKKFQEEIVFLFYNTSKLTQNQGCFILGTSIKLTNIDNNPLNVIVNHPNHDTEGMIGWGKGLNQSG